jgi:hypothetical protein
MQPATWLWHRDVLCTPIKITVDTFGYQTTSPPPITSNWKHSVNNTATHKQRVSKSKHIYWVLKADEGEELENGNSDHFGYDNGWSGRGGGGWNLSSHFNTQWDKKLYIKILLGQWNKKEMGGECSANGGQERFPQGFSVETWGKEITMKA